MNILVVFIAQENAWANCKDTLNMLYMFFRWYKYSVDYLLCHSLNSNYMEHSRGYFYDFKLNALHVNKRFSSQQRPVKRHDEKQFWKTITSEDNSKIRKFIARFHEKYTCSIIQTVDENTLYWILQPKCQEPGTKKW